MTLVYSRNAGGGGRRTIRRFTGAVRGSLKTSLPYLFVFETGATRTASNSRDESRAGRFVVGAPAGRGTAFRTGMILPIARCKDAALRRQLELLALTFCSDESRARSDPVRMALAESMLKNSPWAEVLRVDGRFGSLGECAFHATQALVPLLKENFEYVRELDDDPRGDAVPLAHASFPADSYGNLMEWYHGLSESGPGWMQSIWNRLSVALVFDDNADAFTSFGATHELEKDVALDLERLLAPAPVVRMVEIKLEMRQYGWIDCCLSAGGATTSHSLSEVFPPFDNLLAWCKAVRDDRTPVAFSFDEEGRNTNFEAHRLGPDRVLFLVRETYGGKIHLSCVCSAGALAEAFRCELAAFFRDRFDPQHWSEYTEPDYKGAPLLARMVNDPWLAGRVC